MPSAEVDHASNAAAVTAHGAIVAFTTVTSDNSSGVRSDIRPPTRPSCLTGMMMSRITATAAAISTPALGLYRAATVVATKNVTM